MRIAIVGTGVVGRTLGQAFVQAGHDVVVGTRNPEHTRPREEWAGVDLPLVPYDEVASGADVVVNATFGSGSIQALESVGKEALKGKVLIDVTNPLDVSRGFPPTLFVQDTDSLAEQIQRQFPDTLVVKSLNTMSANVMVNPGQLGDGDTSVFVAGNDAGARSTVAALLADLGWKDVVDLGDLTAARGLEMWIALWLRLFGTFQRAPFNIKVVR